MRIAQTDLLLSIGNSVLKGLSYQQWIYSACAEFGVFQPRIEKEFGKVLVAIQLGELGDEYLDMICELKNLPGEFKQKPKSPILAGHLTGKNFGMDGRIVKEPKRFLPKKSFKSYSTYGIAAGRKDKPKRW